MTQHLHFKRITALLIFILLFLNDYAKAPALTTKELATPPPRIIRTCCSFGANLGIIGIPFVKKTDITSIKTIGPHEYLGGNNENNGNIYTKRGGFIDMGHLRDCADWTAYLYTVISIVQKNGSDTIINLGSEGGAKTLNLYFNHNYDSLSNYELAGKIAYDLSLWHEIATWFGASYVPLLPERYSSFSPEDLYSNLLGIQLAIRALESQLEYNEAMTLLINEMLDCLECVTTEEETYDAMEKVNNNWWTSEKRLPNKKVLLKHNLDTETELTPWLVPEEEYSPSPYKIKKPDSKFSEDYQLSIKLNHKFPLRSMFLTHNRQKISQHDFDMLMRYIQNDIHHLELRTAFQIQRQQLRREYREAEKKMRAERRIKRKTGA